MVAMLHPADAPVRRLDARDGVSGGFSIPTGAGRPSQHHSHPLKDDGERRPSMHERELSASSCSSAASSLSSSPTTPHESHFTTQAPPLSPNTKAVQTDDIDDSDDSRPRSSSVLSIDSNGGGCEIAEENTERRRSSTGAPARVWSSWKEELLDRCVRYYARDRAILPESSTERGLVEDVCAALARVNSSAKTELLKRQALATHFGYTRTPGSPILLASPSGSLRRRSSAQTTADGSVSGGGDRRSSDCPSVALAGEDDPLGVAAEIAQREFETCFRRRLQAQKVSANATSSDHPLLLPPAYDPTPKDDPAQILAAKEWDLLVAKLVHDVYVKRLR
ncbi:hypothetical protein PYCC9005_004539 [Savitreella phatthalungensis]